MESYRTVIIGAGPTGLGAAYRLNELGISDYIVLEAKLRVGGLAASFIDDNGFTWDIGGHVQFSHYRYFDDLMIAALGEEGWLHHDRSAWIRMFGRFIPYPIQNNIHLLPREEMWRCLEGLVAINKQGSLAPPEDFEAWIRVSFGEGLAEVFMLPYNFKVWAHPAEMMSYQWIGERVAVTDLRQVLYNLVYEQDDVRWGPNNRFQFPKHGGTGSIWEAVAGLSGGERIRTAAEVQTIFPRKREITLASGEKIGYGNLLSTIPLDTLVTRVEGFPDPLRRRAGDLLHSSVHIVGIGFEGEIPEELRTKSWMYFPEDNCPFFRVTVFSNYSPNNVPDASRYWSLMAEVSESPHKPVDAATIEESVIAGMRNAGLTLGNETIASRWSLRIEYGYPTPSLERDAILAEIQPALSALGVDSRGRFGGWKYEVSNQDHSLMQGVEWVNRVELGVPETTYPFPATANANWGRD